MSRVIGSAIGYGGHVRPAAGYTTTANDYDGTNDYATRGAGLTGAADSKTGTLSLWLRFDGGDATTIRFFNGANTASILGVLCTRNSANQFIIQARNASDTVILSLRSLSTYTVASGWLHLLCSWDLATPEAYLYINDADDEDTITETDDTIDYTKDDWTIGADNAGNSKMNGCISEFWFEDTFLDITVESNRRKFIDGSSKPVDLGSDGSTPTGASPLIYAPDGDPSTNAGTGGNFTITGALTACSDSPSD